VTFNDLRGTAVTRLAIAECTEAEIATVTGHSLRGVRAVLDSHYLSRDQALGESAIRKLEKGQPSARTTRIIPGYVQLARAIGPLISGTHEHEYKLWRQVKLPKGKILIPGVVSHASLRRHQLTDQSMKSNKNASRAPGSA
jgi:hypothetical protein